MWKNELVDTYKSVLEETTEEQMKILKKFRESLGVELNHRHTDELLVKFLRAKNFNLEAAKKIFLENYYNRWTFGINTILETYQMPEIAVKYSSFDPIGYARDGTLVRYMAAGRIDFYGLFMSMSCHALCVYFSYVMEQDIQALEDENKKSGKNVSEVTYIIDLEGFSLQSVLHKNVIEMALDYVRLSQDCYPEIWRNVLIVNAPKIFHTAFSLLKPVLRSAIKDRIHIIDKDSTKYTLLRYIDEDVLPAFLGGNRVDAKGDPLCREIVKFAGQIPEKFYIQNSKVLLTVDDPAVREVHIGPRSTFNMIYPVKEVGSVVSMVARTEGGSIDISLFHKDFGPDPDNTELPGEFENLQENPEYKQISVQIKCQMHSAQEDCQIKIQFPGILVIRFSNASNWFTQRKLYYICTVTPPEPPSQALSK